MVRIVSVVMRLGTTSEKRDWVWKKHIKSYRAVVFQVYTTPFYMLPVGDSVECCAMQKVVYWNAIDLYNWWLRAFVIAWMNSNHISSLADKFDICIKVFIMVNSMPTTQEHLAINWHRIHSQMMDIKTFCLCLFFKENYNRNYICNLL